MLVNRSPTSTCSTSSRVARTTAKYLSIISFRPLLLSSSPPSSLLPPPFYMLTKQTVVDVHRGLGSPHRVGTFSPPPPFPSPLLSFLSLFSLILSSSHPLILSDPLLSSLSFLSPSLPSLLISSSHYFLEATKRSIISEIEGSPFSVVQSTTPKKVSLKIEQFPKRRKSDFY